MVDRADSYAAISFDSVVDAVFGLYFWEWFITLDFDFSFICGRRKFKWPMPLKQLITSYRIFLLNNGWRVNCRALYTTILLLRHTALWASSVSLSIRTMTLWEYSRRIMIIIVPLIAFHMAAVCLASTLDLSIVRSEVAFAQVRCGSIDISNFGIASLYIYNVVLDFIILCLTSYKLLYNGGARIRIKRIPIFMLLFRDGLVYFVVVCLMLDNNIAMAIGMHVVPATATITAGRAVRRLYNYAGPVQETT
ncbi:hypothetical protein C8J56DRAFT_913872 [Mycena floridula]|nr:hypothetical protein C8J56DRAFT_913872 [Mycena floridula]